MKLSEKIYCIANGISFDVVALHQARASEITTFYDAEMISRIICCRERPGDYGLLKEFSDRLTEFESKE